MSEDDNVSPDGAGEDVNTSLLGDNPPDAGNDDGGTPPEPVFQLDDDGNQVLDDDGKPIEVAPDEINYTDFDMPDGMEVDTAFLDASSGTLKELGLNQEQAQKIVSLYADKVSEQTDAMNAQIGEWQNEARSDSEYGGDAFNANIGLAGKALGEFGNDALKQVLDDTGMGNHPEVIRFMVNVGKTLSEDNPGLGNSGGQPKTREEILYPKQT